MDALAKTIFETKKVTDDEGREWPLHSQSSPEQCEQLQELVRQVKPKTSLEVGLAYGLSALNICAAMKEVGGQKHIIMDPYQDKFQNIGLRNLRIAGYESMVEFHRKLAHEVLPGLLDKKVQVDFAYLDGSKVFDVVLINVYFLTRFMPVGGMIVMDDCDFPGIRKLCQFVAKMPCYEIAGSWDANPKKVDRKFWRAIANTMPGGKNVFTSDLIDAHPLLKGRPHCVAFRKISEDTRNWDWHENF